MINFRTFRFHFVQFIGFGFWSGLGWLCDLATFTLLVKVFEVPAFVANFISSYVGVTFVWFTSLKAVFGHTGASRGRFLAIYWGYQFASILAYSQFLHLVAGLFLSNVFMATIANNPEVAAKIFVTPFNLVSNFLFMKYLTRYMRNKQSTHV